MKLYYIKDAFRDSFKEQFNLAEDNYQIGIVSPDQIKVLINLNLLHEYCIEIPYQIEVGDWVKCVDEPTFDMSSFTPHAKTITNGTAWEKDKVFKVSGIKWGGGVVEDGWSGTYLSWVRPMTDEEVKLHLDKERQKKEFTKQSESQFDSFMKVLKNNKYSMYGSYGIGLNR